MFKQLCIATILAICADLCTSTVEAKPATIQDLRLDRSDLVEKDHHHHSSSSRGPRGKRGKRGKRGSTGHEGSTGPSGSIGRQGPQGPQGIPGQQGPTGATGATGPQGPTGPVGPTGATGPHGHKGEKGDRGHSGHRGKRGPRGKDGKDGKDGLPGRDGKNASGFAPLSCDIFVDGSTALADHDQTGSIAAPFSSIQKAVDKARFVACTSCKNCKTVNILIAAGCYNLGDADEDAVISIVGPTKVNLIGLGPVAIGHFSDCACQPSSDQTPVSINWSPSVCDLTSGVRPTLTITTLNTMADSMTPYQSYSNKFRVSGSINISSNACGNDICEASTETSTSTSTTTNGVHYRHKSSDKVRVHQDGDMTRKHSSSDFAGNTFFDARHRSKDEVKFSSSTSVTRKHKSGNRYKNSSGSIWESGTSISVHESADHGTRERSSYKWHQTSSGRKSGTSSSSTTHYSVESRPRKGYHVSDLEKKPITQKSKKKSHHKKSYGRPSKVKGKKRVEKGILDFFAMGGEQKPVNEPQVMFDIPAGSCQAGECDLCCGSLIGSCLPAELHLNGEVFGDLNVSGVAMLYLYKSRIHGFLAAPNSDLVVAERTRFDNTATIHYYGYIFGNEFLGGVTVTDQGMWDYLGRPECTKDEGAGCNSLFLTGFIDNFFCGNFTGPPGAVFGYDPLTGCSFVSNGGNVVGGASAESLVSYCVDASACPPVVSSCTPGLPAGCAVTTECTGCPLCTP